MGGPIGMLGQLGEQAASNAVDSVMGLVAGEINDRRQLRQQKKLNEQQFEIDGRALARQKAADLGMIQATSYGFQKEQMKNAGLSPGLMYGGGGAGGAVTGGTGSTNAPKAPQGGGEIMGMQLMNAQKELIQAQTEKTKVETTKTAGVDTQLTEAQGRLAKNVAQFYVDTYEDNYDKLKAEVSILERNSRVNYATEGTEIETKKAELVGLGIANELKKAQTELTEEQMKATAEMVKQKWEEVSIRKGHLDLDKFIKDVKDSTKLTTESIIRVIGLMR